MIQFSSRLLWRTAAGLLAVAFVALVAVLSFGSGGSQGSAREAVPPRTPNAPPQTPPPPTPTVDALTIKPPTLSPADAARAAALPTATVAPPREENGVIVLNNTTNTLTGGQTYQIGGLRFAVPKGVTIRTSSTTGGFIFEEVATGSVLRIDPASGKEVYRRLADGPPGAAAGAAFDALLASFMRVEATP